MIAAPARKALGKSQVVEALQERRVAGITADECVKLGNGHMVEIRPWMIPVDGLVVVACAGSGFEVRICKPDSNPVIFVRLLGPWWIEGETVVGQGSGGWTFKFVLKIVPDGKVRPPVCAATAEMARVARCFALTCCSAARKS